MRILNNRELGEVTGSGCAGGTTHVFWNEFLQFSGLTAGIMWGAFMPPLILAVDVIEFSITKATQLFTYTAYASYEGVRLVGDYVLNEKA